MHDFLPIIYVAVATLILTLTHTALTYEPHCEKCKTRWIFPSEDGKCPDCKSNLSGWYFKTRVYVLLERGGVVGIIGLCTIGLLIGKIVGFVATHH